MLRRRRHSSMATAAIGIVFVLAAAVSPRPCSAFSGESKRPDFIVDVEFGEPGTMQRSSAAPVRVVHPVFAVATPTVLAAWDDLEAASKAESLVGRRRTNRADRNIPPSLKQLVERASAELVNGVAGRSSENDRSSSEFLQIMLPQMSVAFQQVAALQQKAGKEFIGEAGHATGRHVVFFTDDLLGLAPHQGDILLSKDAGRFAPPILHPLADLAEDNKVDLEFLVLVPVVVDQDLIFSVVSAMKAAQNALDRDTEVDDDHQGSAFSMHTWFRSIADRIAGVTTELLLLDTASYACVPIGNFSGSAFAPAFATVERVLVGLTDSVSNFSASAIIHESVTKSRLQNSEGQQLRSDDTLLATADGLLRDLRANLGLLHEVCARSTR